MQRTGLPDLADPAFAPIRARLAKAFMENKGDLGVVYATDEAILQRTDAIAWMLLEAAGKAFIARDAQWLQRYSWFTDLVIELLDDEPGKPLDG